MINNELREDLQLAAYAATMGYRFINPKSLEPVMFGNTGVAEQVMGFILDHSEGQTIYITPASPDGWAVRQRPKEGDKFAGATETYDTLRFALERGYTLQFDHPAGYNIATLALPNRAHLYRMSEEQLGELLEYIERNGDVVREARREVINRNQTRKTAQKRI